MAIPPRLRTARLELIASTAETTSLELHDVGRLAAVLQVPLPTSWPPPLNDESSQRWYLDMLQRDAAAVGWGLWYLIDTTCDRQLVGVAGFKGRPSGGSCELGYSVLPPFHGRGYSAEASRRLIMWAFTHPDVEQVVAETLPDLPASIWTPLAPSSRYDFLQIPPLSLRSWSRSDCTRQIANHLDCFNNIGLDPVTLTLRVRSCATVGMDRGRR